MSPGTADPIGVVAERRGALGRIVLDRPAHRNAIDAGMRRAISEALTRWARDAEIYAIAFSSANPRVFCAGGDVRVMSDLAARDPAAAQAEFAEELLLVWQIECFPKPIVALIDGAVLGTGVGMTLYGTHRVAGRGYRLAMPEAAIGFHPDVGVTRALARAPGGIGRLAGLSGRFLSRGEAWRAGLATHCIDADRFAHIEERLADADPVDPLLDGLHRPDAGDAEETVAERIARRCMLEAAGVEAVLAALAAIADTEPEADRLHAEIMRKCPTSLVATDRLISHAATLGIADTLRHDYRIGSRLMLRPDFREGVRAVLVDKDGAPRWQPATLRDIKPAEIDALFEAPPGGDLKLPPADAIWSQR
ncbi:MAG: enoyl-CoA hydratase/isomerase family protein [Hyphomicrobiales bacterium]|nr:enoyl-CoA hydratase/isomerase family protein [Hyphomicrobiales bacterium]